MLDFINSAINLLNSNILFLAVVSFYVLFFLILILWDRSKFFFTLDSKYDATDQRVHEGKVPRLGGFILFFLLIFFSFFLFGNGDLQKILLCLIPMMFTSIKEDMFYNAHFITRLLGLIISVFSLMVFTGINFPIVNHLYFISDLFQYTTFNIIFFSICLVALANGCNFIDGMNGLLSFYLFGALMSCFHLSYFVGDINNGKLILFYGLLILCFISVNYPWGKIFLGDSGAYLLGILIGIWVINFFGNNELISSWNAVLIFFYPVAEVIYSFIRKILQKKSPFRPDREHLHLKIYAILNVALKNSKLSNNLTSIFLAIFWLGPPLILPWAYNSQIMLFTSIFSLAFTYISLNLTIPIVKSLKS